MVIDGVRLVEEALHSGLPIELLIYDPKAQADHPRLAALVTRAEEARIRAIPAAAHVIAACSQVETSQGILAVTDIPRHDLNAVLNASDLLLVVVDKVQDPGNLGTIIRIADAAGASAVAVTAGSVDPHHPKTVRAAMGSLFHLPVLEVDAHALVADLQRRSVRIMVADPRGAVEFTAASYQRPLALVLGSEAAGPDALWREAASTTVRIPIYGRAESLNVAITAGLLLYEARRQSNRL